MIQFFINNLVKMTISKYLNLFKKKLGLTGDWTRDLLHPKQESYH